MPNAAVFKARNNTKTCVKRAGLLCTKLHKIVHLYHPLPCVCSHIFAIIPGLDSGKLFHFACPVHCWTSNRSFSKLLPMQHSANPSFMGKTHDVAKASNVEKRSCQPMFLCEMLQPFLARADSRCAEFRATDPSSKSNMLGPRTSHRSIGRKWISSSTISALWMHRDPAPKQGIDEYQFVSDGNIWVQKHRRVLARIFFVPCCMWYARSTCCIVPPKVPSLWEIIVVVPPF